MVMSALHPWPGEPRRISERVGGQMPKGCICVWSLAWRGRAEGRGGGIVGGDSIPPLTSWLSTSSLSRSPLSPPAPPCSLPLFLSPLSSLIPSVPPLLTSQAFWLPLTLFGSHFPSLSELTSHSPCFPKSGPPAPQEELRLDRCNDFLKTKARPVG